MTVIIEVPTGHKFCKRCGGVFPKATGFYQLKKTSKATGVVSIYPRDRCKGCQDKSSASRPRKYKPAVDRTPKPTSVRYVAPRDAAEVPIDAAFMGWRVPSLGMNVPNLGARL